ncbi:MAG: hypothetical protein M1609_07555, partial [Firmicutes bacterium]|nr:hypothetical protein [Bacillota bacterium]
LATIIRDVPLACAPGDCRMNIDLVRGTQALSELGISSINLLLFKPQEKVKRTRKTEVARVILRSNGGKDYCGVCGHYGIPCGKFIELHDGKINIMGQQFWACEECENELIGPEYYKKISDSEAVKRHKSILENRGAYIQPGLFV